MFGAVSAVYLGIYLILPGCLCQLLHCFGGTPVDSLTRSEERSVLTNNSNLTICHCHDVASKTVEPTQTSEKGSDTFAGPAALLEDANQHVPSQISAELANGRAPPFVGLPSITSLRSFTGVYLI